MKTLPPDIDREIARALRGKRTQAQFSRVLGYGFNQCYLWEAGRRRITWSDLEKICEKLGFSALQRTKDFFHLQDARAIHEVLAAAVKGRKKSEVAAAVEVTQSKLSRWLTGHTDPPLISVLRIFSLGYLNVPEFIDGLAGAGRVESIQSEVSRARAMKEALFRLPFVGAVGAALFTEQYKKLKTHQPGVLAKLLGITLAEEEEAIRALLDSGQLVRKGGAYQMTPYHINLAHDRKQFLSCCQYWTERALKIIPRNEPRQGFGYRVFAVNEDMAKRVRQAQIDYYHAITEILKGQEGPYDRVMAVNFHGFFPGEDV